MLFVVLLLLWVGCLLLMVLGALLYVRVNVLVLSLVWIGIVCNRSAGYSQNSFYFISYEKESKYKIGIYSKIRSHDVMASL